MTKKTDSASFKNHFLLALPSATHSEFAGTLTYLCDHDENGAMGLVINKPTGVALKDILEQLDIEPNDDGPLPLQPIFAGGPVQTERGFILHSDGHDMDKWNATLEVANGIRLTTSRDILSSIALDEGPTDSLVALGYAGWGPGQLEQELNDNCWLTTPADTDIIFRTPYQDRLDAAVAKLGIKLEQVSPQAGHA